MAIPTTAITHYSLSYCGRAETHAPHDYESMGSRSCPGASAKGAAQWVLCSTEHKYHPAVRVLGDRDVAIREYRLY
jgi:hypothetical protein